MRPFIPGRIANYNIAKGAETFGLPYDYCSIMHYRDTTFSADKMPVITTREPKFQVDYDNNKDIQLTLYLRAFHIPFHMSILIYLQLNGGILYVSLIHIQLYTPID
jgi:hypothetical protein